MAEVGEDLGNDKAYGVDMLGPFEVMGIDRFEKSTAILRGRVKTRAGQQWRIGREYNRRIRMRFEKEGIDNPFRVSTVQIVGNPQLQQLLDPDAAPEQAAPATARSQPVKTLATAPAPHPEDEP
jgi:small conductance mechanosensitive channel